MSLQNVKMLRFDASYQDAAQVVMDQVGAQLDRIPAIFGPRVLVAKPPSMDRTAGGIFRTDKGMDEDRWQGKVGLVIKLGHDAFKYHPRYPQYDWEGPKADVGQWVHFFSSDAREIGFAGMVCAYIWDSDILGIASDPESVW